MPSIFKSSSRKAKGRGALVIGEPQGVKGGPGYMSKYVETGLGEFGALPGGTSNRYAGLSLLAAHTGRTQLS